MARRWWVPAAVAAVVLGSGAVPARAQEVGESIPAPATQLSPDGKSASDGIRTLTVAQASAIDPAGQTLAVSGTGYDDFKGVYVAFCLIPPTNQLPTPCGGGMDQTGASGASTWISSNPPPYATGLSAAYGPGGSFSASITVTPTIGSIDCRRVRCAIVTRNDHTRSSDRSQDIFVPITFASASAATAPPVTVAPPTTVAPVTTSPPTTAAPTTLAPPSSAVAGVTDSLAPSTTTRDDDASEIDAVAAAASHDDGDSGGRVGLVIAIAVVLVAVAAAVAFILRRRLSR